MRAGIIFGGLMMVMSNDVFKLVWCPLDACRCHGTIIYTKTYLTLPMKRFDLSFLAKLILFDLGFVVLHLVFSPQYSLFNLDAESNLPTVYQGLKSIGIGVLVLAFGYRFYLTRWERYSIWMTSAFFIGLGADEMAEIHENVPVYVGQMFPEVASFVGIFAQNIGYQGSLWVIYFFPIILGVLILWGVQLSWIALYKKQTITPILIPIVLVLCVPLIEWINTSSGFSPEVYSGWIAFEEFIELVGISLMGAAYLRMYSEMFCNTGKDRFEVKVSDSV